MVEWGRLLSGYRGEILGRRFESCPPRHEKRVATKVGARFCSVARPHSGDDIRILSSPPQKTRSVYERVF